MQKLIQMDCRPKHKTFKTFKWKHRKKSWWTCIKQKCIRAQEAQTTKQKIYKLDFIKTKKNYLKDTAF